MKLTVRSVQDLELPFVGLGPEWRNQTLVFTHVDKNTKIYGGRYKNTFNFDRGATFQGALVGGEGYGSFLNMPGSNMDKLREAYSWVEDTMGGLSVSDLEGLIYNVENTLSYSNPLNPNNYGTGLHWKDFVTKVNYEKLAPPSGSATANKIAQVALGNWAALGIDALGWQETTGLSGRIENFGDINLGDIIVRSGINLVRGSDYNPYDTEMGNPLAVFTSGSDTISIGDNYASLTPGFHILAGGSGGDTYKFNSQYWGFSLIVDDFAAPLDLNNISSGNNVGDAILSGLIPRDVLDFSNFYSDLYFTVFEASVEDIAALNGYMPTDNELTNVFNYINPGASLVMVTTVPLPVPGYSDSDSGEDQIGEFRLSNLLPYLGTAQMALAVGVEDIVGGRGNNLVSFINGAELNGRLEPGFGGNMALDYSRYHGSLKSTGASGGSPEETGWESEVVIGSNPYSDFEVVPSMQDIVNGMGDWLSENVKVTKSEANSEVTYTVTFPERLGDVNELNSDIIGSSQSITHITATEGSNETSEVQTFNLPSGLSASDLFVLTFKDQTSKEETTVSLPGNAEADAVQKALNDLASIQWFTTPEFIDSLLPSVMYTYADATGTKGSLGVGETGDVSGSKFNDSLVGNKNDNKFEGHGGNDLLKGGEGNDTLNGGEGDDKLDGGNGNDNLDGGKGDDKLFGGPGDDILNPGNGDDLLDGGSGLDSYIPSSNNSLIVFDNAASPLGITHSTTTEFSEGNDEIQTFEVPSWLTGFIGFQLQFTKADSEVETTVSLAYDADATAVQNALNNLSSLTGVTVAKSNKTYTVTFPTTLGNVRELTSKIISLSPEITHSTPTEGDNPVAEVQTFELPSGLGESNQFELIFTGSDSQAETTTSLGYDADATAVQNALNSLSSLTGVTVAKLDNIYTVTFPTTLGNVAKLTSQIISPEITHSTSTEGDDGVGEVQTFELPSGLGESNQFELIFTGSDSQAETTDPLAYDADATVVQNALNSLSSLTGVTVAKLENTFTVTFSTTLGNVATLTSQIISPEITHSTSTQGEDGGGEVQTFELPSVLDESNQFELVFTESNSQAKTTVSLAYDADATAVENALNSLSSLTGVTVAKSNKTYTVTFPASLGNVDELTSNFNSLEYDALTGVEIIQIDGSSSLPKRATFITSDSLDPVFLVNPNGLKDLDLETYYFHINSKSRINLKGYESDKINFGSYDNTGKTQTLTLYSDSAKGEGHRLLTMVVTGHESAISASDINFTRDDLLLAESTGALAAYYALTQEAIRPLLSEAKSRWLQATGFDPLVAESLENLRVSVADLNGAGLAKTFQNHITVDLNAAGNGWFVDPTPDADEEFSIVPTNELRNADSNSDAYGRYDLLSVLLHEFGHSLGLSHTSEGGQLMSSELRAGTRTVVSDEVISFVSVGYPVTDFQEAAPVSDQTKILDGLDKFATWAAGLGNTLGNYVADSTQLPFMKQSISDFWNAAPGKITSEIDTQIREQILHVFKDES